jgi:hypothetical protein
MKNIVKLLTAVLVFGFLVGCGGGGGGSSSNSDNTPKGDDPTTPGGGDTSISLALIGSYFPAFPDSTYTLHYVDAYKWYSPSAAQISNFNTTILQAQSYSDSGSGLYHKSNVLTDIDAYVIFDDDGVGLNLDSYAVTPNDANFKTVFGSLSWNIIGVLIEKEYDEDISSKYAAYAASTLAPKGFNCHSSSGDWECEKTVDGITYGWYTINNYGYEYDIFTE